MNTMKNTYWALVLIVLSVFVGCKAGGNDPGRVYMPDMMYSRAYEAYTLAPEGSPVKYSSLLPVAGTIPRGILPSDTNGLKNESMIKSYLMKQYFPNTPEGYEKASELQNPLPKTKANIERGKELYSIYCSPCHGDAGDGQGPVVASGKYNGVPTYKDRLPTINDGKAYFSICYGKGKMGSHSGQINPTEIWKVVMYINTFVNGAAKYDADGNQINASKAQPISVAKVDTTKK